MNQRPHGPCLDTTASLEAVEKALLRFLDPKYLDPHYLDSASAQDKGETISTGQAAGRPAPGETDRAAHDAGKNADQDAGQDNNLDRA